MVTANTETVITKAIAALAGPTHDVVAQFLLERAGRTETAQDVKILGGTTFRKRHPHPGDWRGGPDLVIVDRTDESRLLVIIEAKFDAKINSMHPQWDRFSTHLPQDFDDRPDKPGDELVFIQQFEGYALGLWTSMDVSQASLVWLGYKKWADHPVGPWGKEGIVLHRDKDARDGNGERFVAAYPRQEAMKERWRSATWEDLATVLSSASASSPSAADLLDRINSKL